MRSRILLVALVLTSAVLSACASSSTAPTSHDTCSGYIDTAGRCIDG